MATITLDAVVYDGKQWRRDDDNKATGAAAFLEEAGCRQVTVYDAMYGSKLVLCTPDGDRVEVGDTMVFDGDRYVLLLQGDRTDKPKPTKKATKTAKTTKAAKRAS